MYAFTGAAFDQEGTWRWDVSATDDLGRTSTVERTFRYDTTLRGLAVPHTARGRLAVRFTLSRRGEGAALDPDPRRGAPARRSRRHLQPGAQSIVWDGRLPRGSRAYAGTYVAHVLVTSAVGASELTATFLYRR